MLERIRELLLRWQDLREVEALSARDLHDLGVSRSQIEAFVRMPRDVPDRLARMAAIFGLRPEDLRRQHEAYVDLVENCGGCQERRACARVLARPAASGPADCGFCPNARALAALTEAA